MNNKLYRGVHANHPQWAAANTGQAVPGNLAGTVTPALHNLGGHAQDSRYTSWTHDRGVALAHARRHGPGGVVLDVDSGPPPPGAQWFWEVSPDVWWEQEVLLNGFRSGLGVTNA